MSATTWNVGAPLMPFSVPFSVPRLRRPRVVRTQLVGFGLHGHPLLAHAHRLSRTGLLVHHGLLTLDGHLDIALLEGVTDRVRIDLPRHRDALHGDALLLEQHGDRLVLLHHLLVEAYPALFL